MTLAPGARLGPYEIVAPLGAGGMGEVYRARDTRLKREVAIKVLPQSVSADPDRLRRFEQEALATAALNHPNILAVFDVGAHEGAPYVVSELLEGETLRELLKRGRLPVRRAIDYGVQVARGLAAAHEKGVVHRDLKPENLFVTRDGRAKILDFGLAKLTQPRSSDPSGPTSGPTLEGETEPGVVMGTVGYMSPEQVRGQTTDHRTDIFSFGAVLYEMLAGKRAFQKTTSADTMSAILNDDPPSISQLTAGIPPALQRVVQRCLEKSQEQRFQSASDLAFALDALSETSGYRSEPSVSGVATPRKRGLWLGALAAGIVVVLVAAFFPWRHWAANRASRQRHGEIVRRQLTSSAPGDPVLGAAISSDGKFLAYSTALGKKTHILEIASGELRDLPTPDAPAPLSWSPDGSHMLVRRLGTPGLWKVSIWDGSYQKVLDLDPVWYVSISPDGSTFEYGNLDGEMWLIGSNAEDPRRIVKADPDEFFGVAHWSPHGRRLVYVRGKGEPRNGSAQIETCELDGSHRTVVLSDPALVGPNGASPIAWLADGRVIYTAPNSSSAGTYGVWAVSVDPDTGERQGQPTALTSWEQSTPELFSVSADGKRLIYDSHQDSDILFLGDLRSADKTLKSRRLSADEWSSYPGDWDRNSGALFFESRRSDRWVIAKSAPGSDASEVVLSGAANYYLPVLSPDGERLLFTEKTGTSPSERRLMSTPIGGGARSTVLSGRYTYHCGHSPGTGCVLSEMQGKDLVFFVLDPAKGKGDEIQRVDAGLNPVWALSPDGTRIAIAPADTGKWILLLSTADHKLTELPRKGTWDAVQHVTWAADGNHLFATAWSEKTGQFQSILSLDLQGNVRPLNQVKQGAGWLMMMEASPDGHYLAYTERLYGANVTMLENF
ncbi:MAG TPA: protein kinase [Candidatus Binatia bacterium]|nr:protein kinase [Candidatus Binatia bacterium]